MSGEKARKVFFSEKDFSFEQGHQLLRGAVSLILELLIALLIDGFLAGSEIKGHQNDERKFQRDHAQQASAQNRSQRQITRR
jgi:hypothetical protein